MAARDEVPGPPTGPPRPRSPRPRPLRPGTPAFSDSDPDLDPDNEGPLFPEADAEPYPTDAEVRRAIVAMNAREERRDNARAWRVLIAMMLFMGAVVFWILAHPHLLFGH